MITNSQNDNNYMSESMDMRRFFLCLIRKAWMILIVTALCAILGALIYNIYYGITDGQQKYQKCTDFYITFNEADHPNGMDYYNAYTWNQFVTDDRIVNKALSVAGSSVNKQDIKEYVTARMMSDYRVLTVVVTGENNKKVETISEAYKAAMPMFPEEVDEITKIEPWSEDDMVKINDHTLAPNAALLGGVIGFLISLFIWAVYYCMNDRIYTEADFNRRFAGVTFLGYDTERFKPDTEANRKKAVGDAKTVDVTDVSKELGSIEECDGVILNVSWGEHASAVQYKVEMLKKQGIKLYGVILNNSNERFLNMYYGK